MCWVLINMSVQVFVDINITRREKMLSMLRNLWRIQSNGSSLVCLLTSVPASCGTGMLLIGITIHAPKLHQRGQWGHLPVDHALRSFWHSNVPNGSLVYSFLFILRTSFWSPPGPNRHICNSSATRLVNEFDMLDLEKTASFETHHFLSHPPSHRYSILLSICWTSSHDL